MGRRPEDELHDQSTMPAPGETPASGGGPRGQSPMFPAGTVLAKRYRVVRFIARGGMGEVYEAEDQELGERVALKTIHPDRVGDTRAVERFKREIFLARKVTHRNVCRLFDVGFHESTTFLTMELLEGETLATRIFRAGRMAAAQALPIVQQMAAALDAAHAAGVVHRDFKSPNVILCAPRTGSAEIIRAVVTDFGLARGPRGGDDPQLSLSGEMVGSPGYMAPEQVEGREVGPAADVYALGVVLFEMVTGRLPFVADTPLATAVKRLKQPPPSPRGAAPDLDNVWEAAILRCLAMKAGERFPSAGAVARALDTGRAGRPDLAATTAAPAPKRRLGKWIAIPAAIALAGAAGYFLWPRQKLTTSVSAPAAGRRAVAVVGFRNTTGRADTAWLASALVEMMSTELAATEQLRTVPAETVARVKLELSLPDADTLAPETLARFRKNTGADLIVVGSYVALGSGAGRKVRVDLHLQDAAAGQTLASLSETGQEEALFDLVTRAGSELRRRIGVEPMSAAVATRARATLPQKPEAARAYAEGLARARAYDLTGARTLLQEASKAEPGFALAHSALADVLWELGYERDARAAARRALDAGADLPREDRLLAEARHHRMTGAAAKALDIYRALHSFFPDDLEHGIDLVGAQIAIGRPQDALATLDELRKLAPPLGDDPRLDLAEAEAVAESDFRRQQAAAQRAAKKAEAQGARLLLAQARRFEGSALDKLGQHREALDSFEQARQLREAVGDRGGVAVELINMAVQRGALGDPDADLKLCEQALAICREIGDRIHEVWALIEIGGVHEARKETELAKQSWEAAAALAHQAGRTADEALLQNNLAVMLMRAGDLDGAIARWDEVLRGARETGQKRLEGITLYNAGNARLRKGELAAARRLFDDSLRLRQKLEDAESESLVQQSIAFVMVEQGDLEGATERAQAALAIARKQKLAGPTAAALFTLADVARERGDATESKKRLDEAIAVAEPAHEDDSVADAKSAQAQLALDAGDRARTVELARAALEIFAHVHVPRREAAAHALLARALGSAEEAQKAAAILGPRPIYPEFFTVALARGRGPALDAAAVDARRLGFLRWQLELDLARGGRTAEVERSARAHGLLRLATAAGQPSRRHVSP